MIWWFVGLTILCLITLWVAVAMGRDIPRQPQKVLIEIVVRDQLPRRKPPVAKNEIMGVRCYRPPEGF